MVRIIKQEGIIGGERLTTDNGAVIEATKIWNRDRSKVTGWNLCWIDGGERVYCGVGPFSTMALAREYITRG